MRLINTAAALAATIALAGSSLVGCSTGPAAQTSFCAVDARSVRPSSNDHAIVVVGNVAGAPTWSLTEKISAALSGVLETGGRVDLVSTAGNGYLCAAEHWGEAVTKADANPRKRDQVLQANLIQIVAQLAQAPRENGSDAYAALHLAADQFASIGSPHKVLVLLASGLNDHGDLDYTAGLLGSEPKEVVSSLKHLGPLPDLGGVTVVVAGIGWTAPDQEPLNDRLRSNVEQTYAAVLSASGAQVNLDPAPQSGPGIDTLGHTTKPTPVPSQPSVLPSTNTCEPVERVFDQTSALQFVGDMAKFVDANAARDALTPIAGWLAADPTKRRVSIAGTTARATSRANQMTLSLARAKAAQKLLVNLGVDSEQITKVAGVGSWFVGYVDDQDSTGELLPGPAARNRSVRLTLSQSC